MNSQEDISLAVSGYFDEEPQRVVYYFQEDVCDHVIELLRAYGFTQFGELWTAPGSRYFRFTVEFGTRDRNEARESKKALQEDLTSDELPPDEGRRHAVKKFKASLLDRARKKLTAVVVLGSFAIGSVAANAAEKLGKEVLEAWVGDRAPALIEKADKVVAQELPGRFAQSFHEFVSSYIEKHPNKHMSYIVESSDTQQDSSAQQVRQRGTN